MAPSPIASPGPAPSAIGVVGGGQLAWMLAAAAQELNLPLHVQTPSGDDPAAALAAGVIQAPLDDVAATRRLSAACQAITFENEWVDLAALASLAQEGVTFLPSLEALAPLVSKHEQRLLLQRLGLPSPPWLLLATLLLPESTEPVLPEGWTFPVMAKAATGGYDGKGTRLLNSQQDLLALWQQIDPDDWILEAFVRFDCELSQLACRDHQGNVLCYPLVQTHQHQQVCNWVLTPAAVPHPVQAFARNIAASLLTALDYVGVLSIELFYGPAGLLVNEIAPRTHNSGHVTIEACRTSQFAQQARIVAGLPTGPVDLQVPGALMVNLLGFEHGADAYADRRQQLADLPGASLHWYGKRQASPGRKLGHVTLLLDDPTPGGRQQQAMERLAAVRAIWPLPPGAQSDSRALE